MESTTTYAAKGASTAQTTDVIAHGDRRARDAAIALKVRPTLRSAAAPARECARGGRLLLLRARAAAERRRQLHRIVGQHRPSVPVKAFPFPSQWHCAPSSRFSVAGNP